MLLNELETLRATWLWHHGALHGLIHALHPQFPAAAVLAASAQPFARFALQGSCSLLAESLSCCWSHLGGDSLPRSFAELPATKILEET